MRTRFSGVLVPGLGLNGYRDGQKSIVGRQCVGRPCDYALAHQQV